MRTAHRISSRPLDIGIALALMLMASLVLVALLNVRATPLAAETSQAAPPATFPPAWQSEYVPQYFPVRSPAIPPNVTPDAIPAEDVRVYQGQEFRYVKTLTLRVTGYASDRRCTWPYSGTTTASGLPVTTNGGHLVAADTSIIPMHALVIVPGYAAGKPVPVLDRGGAIRGNRLDVLLPTFGQAQSWGVRSVKVKIYQAK